MKLPPSSPMFAGIQLDITHRCNLYCRNCDRACGEAPTKHSMTVDQVKRFVDETRAVDRWWAHIHVLGGEPTLHPDLFEIFDALYTLRKENRVEKVVLFTNGYGNKVHNVLERMPAWVEIVNSQKTGPGQKFSPHNLAPVDLEKCIQPVRWAADDPPWFPSCRIPYECGMALTRHGYYPCAAGATVDRVFGKKLALMALDPNHRITDEQLCQIGEQLCRYCGHALGFTVDRPVVSPSWKQAFDSYQKKAPEMTLYGDPT